MPISIRGHSLFMAGGWGGGGGGGDLEEGVKISRPILILSYLVPEA